MGVHFFFLIMDTTGFSTHFEHEYSIFIPKLKKKPNSVFITK